MAVRLPRTNGGHHDQLADILPLETAQLLGVAAQVSAGREEFLAHQRIVAGRHEERELRRHGGAGDLDGADPVAGLGQQQGFGEKGSHVEAGGRLVSQQHAVDSGYVAELLVGEVVDHVLVVALRAAGFQVGLLHHLSSGGHDQRAADRDVQPGVILGDGAGDVSQQGETGQGLNVVHVHDPRHEDHRPPHLGSAAHGFIDSFQARDLAHEQFSASGRQLDEEDDKETDGAADDENPEFAPGRTTGHWILRSRFRSRRWSRPLRPPP